MKIQKGTDFEAHPETDGKIQAVIVDVTPTKLQHSQWGDKEVFRIVYETEMVREDGKRYCLWSRGYTPSIDEKSNFRKDVKKILGRDLTGAEVNEFDTESLLGLPVLLMVSHEEGKDGTTYAVIDFLGPDRSGKPLTASGDYVRVIDRPQQTNGTQQAQGQAASYHKAPAPQDDGSRPAWMRCKVHVGRNTGLDLGDLDESDVRALIENWLPGCNANPKPKADDKRLAAALEQAAAELNGAPEPAKDLPY